jgi:hypothetical protein
VCSENLYFSEKSEKGGVLNSGLQQKDFDIFKKKRVGYQRSHARQPVNADGTACGVAPELDELLYGEDTGQVLDAAAVLCMSAFELRVSLWVAG